MATLRSKQEQLESQIQYLVDKFKVALTNDGRTLINKENNIILSLNSIIPFDSDKRDIQCPHCNTEQDIIHEFGNKYNKNYKYKQKCTACDKTFNFETIHNYTYKLYSE